VQSGFIYSKKFSEFKAHKGYPWLFRRSEVTYQLCKKLHLFDHDWMEIYTPKPARTEEVLGFHTKKYISILKKANQGVPNEKWLRYGLGTTECPVFKGVYDYHALAAGATLLGTELISQGKADIVFSPTGGFHHAGKDFAAGFCYINDAVLAIKRWLGQAKRVLYIDIDAHHGDQVQEAFYNTSKAMIISFHESGRTLFPFKTGSENQIGKGRGKGYTINVPLPENTSDDEFLWAFDRIFLPLIRFFGPDVVIALFGVDALFSDPFSHLQLTNTALVKALESIIQISPKTLVLGSGGYTHENIARTWTLAWATMNGLGPTEEDLATFGGMFWGDGLSSLKDQPRFVPDHVKEKAKSELHRMVHAIEDRVFTILGI
jgi:acetoin utilization protein AcuC